MRAGEGPGPNTGGGRSRWRARATALRARLLGLRAGAGAEERFPVITRLTSHLIAVNLLDSATRLAAQAFLTAVPLLFVVASFAPQSVRTEIVDSVHDVLGISGSADKELKKVYGADSAGLRQSTGVVIFTVLSWPIGVCVVVSAGITAGAVIAREPAVARRLGSPDRPDRRANRP
ncbi:hypothetical protein ABZZ47_28975 [Streptomyces sp. NPDC006465]|uniref:hypothetical protein n=1 Tax=Streptomyces sp. NPDC006465 TaxID=3157174 RepID=UPI0033B386AA